MKSNDRKPEQATDSSDENRSVVKSRRSFAKAGIVSPLVMTLISRPAMAGGVCFSPSRSLSKNTSVSQNGNYGECNGISPGNYKTQTNPLMPSYNWPSSVPPSTPFHPLFKRGSTAKGTLFETGTGLNLRSRTLLEVLGLNGSGDPSKLAFHTIGAYLNCVNGFIPTNVLTKEKVVSIWEEYVTNGFYEPFAGVKWYAGDIVSYYQTNYIAP
ncbi:hypothetical protein NP603_04290 [Methylomonas sp. SURF-1]|uniref:Uncharacterized protein n=1 Tax=Methylomonas aurea TaxID=2952224 RepID=A0ABT1UF19_9GAMM|nr:hypothetical protein [Methylomonas sp. SURF-1]MCQ8180319.1 hypothetical protein [Methylomonas sp. SURF-1]